MNDASEICCLCGKPPTDEDPITREHVPSKQFYPKSERNGLNLWTAPAHKSCNGQSKSDEEYFYHALYPLVANANSPMADVILKDLKRRAAKPQTPALMRSVLKTAQITTDGGVFLPPGIVCLNADAYRLQQVAVKIGRCLFFINHNRVMPYDNCKEIRLCLQEEDVPEHYALSWDLSKINVFDLPSHEPTGIVVTSDVESGQPVAACPQVFSYRTYFLEENRLHFYTLMFWNAFMFCMTFEEPVMH